MLRELAIWLGPKRTRLLVALLLGVLALIVALQGGYNGAEWLLSAQIGLVWLFVAAALALFSTRLAPPGRRRLWMTLGPSLLLAGLGIWFPAWALLAVGASFGWIIVAQFILPGRVRMEYQTAIRHLRRSEYDQAIGVMDRLIEAEPDDSEHRRFRAELFRLAGRLDAARQDYEHLVALDPESTVGLGGLAEVYAQMGDYEQARVAAQKAFECDRQNWMAAYNLGMIEDRLGQAVQAVEHLQIALNLGAGPSRYRLLIRLWLARNYTRLGQHDPAQGQLDAMRHEQRGLRDWQVIFSSEQAAPLRGLLEADVTLAERLLGGTDGFEVFGG